MNWTRIGSVAIVLNIVLLLGVVAVAVWKLYHDQAPRWSTELQEAMVDSLGRQVNQSRSADASVLYQGDVDMRNPSRPVLHQGFKINRPSIDSSIVKMGFGAPPESNTSLLQGFQMNDGEVHVPLSGFYLIHMDVTYFFRGHVDESQVNVHVTCSLSDPMKVLVETSQWCRVGIYCSVTFHGISHLSQGAIIYCDANHASDMINAIENTHITLAFC
ncbi:uncharacterized protein [Haliotis asinina]|uniref:uncharacterized protein n=1 Tax=Haliotis asinina TaxID=109174 RepID=UPI003531C855